MQLEWSGLVVLLPVTSLPLIVRLLGSDSVAAPSGIILFLIVATWLLPYLLKNGTVPRQALPFLGFVMVALISTCLASFGAVPPYKDASMIRQQIVAVLTLAVGTCFYLVAMLWPSDENRLVFTLKLINWSGFVVVGWALVQAFVWYAFERYPDWMRDFHELYSIGPLNRQRVLGFALEPSWLAHQLNMLYLPWWLAATARRFSVHRLRFFGLSVENCLFALGSVVLFFTLSRIGLLAYLLMLVYILLQITVWVSHRLSNWLTGRISFRTIDKMRILKWVRVAIIVSMGALYLLGLYGVGYGLSQFDPRTAKLFEFDPGRQYAIMYYAQQINIVARLVYWQAGWTIFNDFPWLGVGLGTAGFYMPSRLSDYAWGLIEVRLLLYRWTTLLNVKSLWVRILAETGIIGFAFFLSWLYVFLVSARWMEKSQRKLRATLGTMGVFLCLGLLLEGFSIDSFALPYIWFSLGLVTAALRVK